ncbi:hypothetical protein R9C00_16225 [Flammeovirgaceae bacterium SG7u.111]|nr:hypothetical protein [Flammeovirgaceae bacterium SG7u.132]WPO33250.1 hypothetical protein R9C00_16225 [Flammeovirgaceae bacterium SG7u.111]
MKKLVIILTVFLPLLCNAQASERVYLHLANELFVPGEIIWYAAYLQHSFVEENEQSAIIHLQIENEQNEVVLFQSNKFKRGEQSLDGYILLSDEFPTGTYRLSAFTSYQKKTFPTSILTTFIQVVTEDEMLKKLELGNTQTGIVGNGLDKLKVTAKLEKESMTTRGKNKLTINLQNREGKALQGSFSVAIKRKNSWKRTAATQVPANISSSAEGSAQTEKWIWIKGKVKSDFTFHDDRANIISFYSPLQNEGYESMVDRNGNFATWVYDFYGEDYFYAYLPGEEKLELELFENEFVKTSLSSSVKDAAIEDIEALRKKVLIREVNGIYGIYPYAQVENIVDRDPLEPNRLFKLEDYTAFETMPEVVKEIINGARVKKKGDNDYEVSIFSEDQKKFFDEEPLFIIDGQLTFDPNELMNLSPQKVDWIGLIINYDYLGVFRKMGINGVMIVQRKEGEEITLNNKLASFALNGFPHPRKFISTTYETPDEQNSRLPDFRSQLFWSGVNTIDVNGDAEVEFTSSDESGEFLVEIEGVTETGMLFSKALPLKVSKEGL